MDEPLENAYFNWLVAKVNRVEHPTPSLTYWNLLRQLHSTEYVWLISGDDNRAEDGVELREEFLIESGYPYSGEWEGMGCSVLEMLIAFARRAKFNARKTLHYWFWRFLKNLGLDEANDASNFPPEEIDAILSNFVWRTYKSDGTGGLFPMRNPPMDQREVEVWYQFCEYLIDIQWPL